MTQRILVLGTTGSGKTTLARKLAEKLDQPHIELDALYWNPGWKVKPLENFRKEVAEAVSGDAWVIDGNYTSKVVDLIWPRAQLAI